MYLQRWHGWCHMKLLPSRRVLCTSYNHATSCKTTYVCVFRCNLPPALLAEWPGSFTCCCGINVLSTALGHLRMIEHQTLDSQMFYHLFWSGRQHRVNRIGSLSSGRFNTLMSIYICDRYWGSQIQTHKCSAYIACDYEQGDLVYSAGPLGKLC